MGVWWWVMLVEQKINFTHKHQISKTYQQSVWIHAVWTCIIKKGKYKTCYTSHYWSYKMDVWMFDRQDGEKRRKNHAMAHMIILFWLDVQYMGWEKIEGDSHLESIIQITLSLITNPAHFIWSDLVDKWWNYGYQTVYFWYLG